MADFENLQLKLVGSLKSSLAASVSQGAPVDPTLTDLLDGLPFYLAPDWIATFRQALAQGLAVNLPNPQMRYWSIGNEMMTSPEGFRDAFYPGVGATDTTSLLTKLMLAFNPALTPGWWSNYAIAFLTDAVRVFLQPAAHMDFLDEGSLANAMASFNSQMTPALFAGVGAVLQQAYPPTAQPIGRLKSHAAAADQLITAIWQGTFTTNVNEGLASGGDTATAAIWLLYELWVLLDAFRVPDVDARIIGFIGNGLQVPDEIGPWRWRPYSAWYPPLSGSDVLYQPP